MITRAILALCAFSVCSVLIGCEDAAHEGKYINTKNPAYQLELKPHGGFSLIEKGNSIAGKYELHEGTLTLTSASGDTTRGEMRGDTIIDENSEMWVLWHSGLSHHATGDDRIMSSFRDAMTLDMESLGADAYQYKIRPSAMGGGAGSYEGYAINAAGPWGNANANATYVINEETGTQLVLLGTSKVVDGASVTITYDGDGKTIGTTASGW